MKKREIQLTKEFKSQTTKAIFAICFFVFTYILLLLLAFAFTALCIFAGITLIVIKPMFATLAGGIGIASLGVLILIFLLKFMFKSHKVDRSHLLEITESEEPQLFKMIHETAQEVGTRFPKKVYLTSEVNASVFYDSSFWSMFLPIKKNLQIGIGLVNTVTKEELKAILAHEFGHFSQRTMKVGSYVYNVNQIIFNMLYDNESYEALMQRWANMSGYFSIFVSIAVSINEGIQWILRKLYEVVNKSYMALSREMEFHADEIAASVTGYEPLKSSLLRISLADKSYHDVLNFYNERISKNVKGENIFSDHIAAIHFLSEVNNVKITNSLPDISTEAENKYDKSKLVIKDQWASHPSVNDRVERLEKTGYTSSSNDVTLANELFKDILETQKQFTESIFDYVEYEGDTQTISTSDFIKEYKEEFISNSFSKIYNGYYNHKNPTVFDVNEMHSIEINIAFEELYSNKKVDLIYTAIALENDIEILASLYKYPSIKTFDYDGIRYKTRETDELIEKLKGELKETEEKIKTNDYDIYAFFKKLETQQIRPQKLAHLYKDYFEFQNTIGAKFELHNKLTTNLQFLNVTTPFETIEANLNNIKPLEEKIKHEITLLISDDTLKGEITSEIRESLEEYTSKEWVYFAEKKYIDENLSVLFDALGNYHFLLSRKYFQMKKALLVYQEDLIQKHQQDR